MAVRGAVKSLLELGKGPPFAEFAGGIRQNEGFCKRKEGLDQPVNIYQPEGATIQTLE